MGSFGSGRSSQIEERLVKIFPIFKRLQHQLQNAPNRHAITKQSGGVVLLVEFFDPFQIQRSGVFPS